MGNAWIVLIDILFFAVLVLYAVWLRKPITGQRGSAQLNVVSIVLIWCAAIAFLAQLPIYTVQQWDPEGKFSWIVSLDPWVKIIFGISIVLHAGIVCFARKQKR